MAFIHADFRQLDELQRELDNLEKLIDTREDEIYTRHKELIAKRDYLQTKTEERRQKLIADKREAIQKNQARAQMLTKLTAEGNIREARRVEMDLDAERDTPGANVYYTSYVHDLLMFVLS
jgi:hypothetical protein